MAEFDFEARLDRMFAEAPQLGDAEYFAQRVLARLNRRWGTRGLLVGGLGVAGGIVGVGQIMGSGLTSQLRAVSSQSLGLVTTAVGQWAMSRADVLARPFNGEALWLIAALAGMALAFVLTRAIEEI
jgi:hypothetical protein